MKHFFVLFLIFACALKSYSQIDSNIKFKPISPKITPTIPVKLKSNKDNLPKASQMPKLNFPKIIPPNVYKETNIFGTKPKPNNSFEIGTAENHFSMTPQTKFKHSVGQLYQDKMTKDLSKTMISEGLKEDKSLLDRTDRYLGDYKTKSNFFAVKYRDYIVIDGDLINIYVNGNTLKSGLFLDSNFGEFNIPLNTGINNIEFVVASTGTSGGNTAELHIADDAGKLIKTEYWNNLALGVKIKMIVVKE
jgi:hypothetical protein